MLNLFVKIGPSEKKSTKPLNGTLKKVTSNNKKVKKYIIG